MLKGLLFIGVLSLVSCASNNKTGDAGTDAVIAHMSKGEKIIGKDWDPKFLQDGFINGEYVAIGSAFNTNLDHNEVPIKMRAEAAATTKLLSSAPTDFKRVVMNALNSVNNDQGNVEESSIKMTTVKALTGMKSNFSDTQCVKKAVPNQELKYDFIKECRMILRVPASNLLSAYDFTLDKNYSIKQKNEIQKILLEELSGNNESGRLPVSVKGQ